MEVAPMRLTLLLLVVTFAACGIKAPPRPPLEQPGSTVVDEPDAGCCGARP
jgi:predicted small lipoprotein YifL